MVGCASTSTYRGGIGAYQDYDGFRDYLNRFSTDSDDKSNYYEDNTYSSSSSSNPQKKVESSIPPPENIKLGEARDSEAIQRATMKPYQINGKWYYPQSVKIGQTYDGIASWYGPNFHNKKTSNGEIYNMNLHTAAHKTLPMNTLVKVVSLDTSKSTIVRINDRGPFVEGRIIDLSAAAAKDIDMVKTGTARVNIEVIGFGGIVSNNVASNSTIVRDMVNSSEFKDEFKTGKVDEVVEGGNFAIQIGAFRNNSGAETFKGTHIYDGYSTIIKQSELNNAPIFKVFVSGFKSEDEARDFIKDKNIDGFLVRE
ncbi:septal ring lytic transglycosylase RlpA family lipoprotein [Helicobacter sp. MIT 14-3879]|nr:septal ring lytic transglycosylase RlpA family protein [Helicobacter sp. MIT 14-3879]RDU64870.1 septal ring lytic transglycosylase RlpA family lipoprotein [Helicobacter sp. MIT 14-3879]